jgi:protease PrsW
MIFLLTVALSFVPAFFYAWIIYWLDRYEKEPRRLLGGAFFWGAVVAVIGAIVWSLVLQGGIFLLTGDEAIAELTGTVLVAPIVEESLKGIAVLLVFLVFRDEFDSILDGIVYAGITALGFAATENVLYLYFGGYQEGGGEGLAALFFLRVILGGWNHALYTAFTGVGLAVARMSRRSSVKLVAPLAGLVVAICAHALHNGMATVLGGSMGLGGLLATLLVDWLGWLLIFCVIVWAITRERRLLTTHLREEVDRQVLTPAHYKVACSSWAQSGARLRALTAGRYRPTSRFYQLCGELAHKKHQRDALGEEGGNSAAIERLRAELASLAPVVQG